MRNHLIQLITSYKPEHRANVLRVVEQAVDAGMPAVQLSWRCEHDVELFSLAERLRKITQAAGAALVINNRLDVALAVDADVLHLGQRDAPVSMIAQLMPATMKLGLTVSSPLELELAEALPIDYYGVGAIFATKTKKDAKEVGLSQLVCMSAMTKRPIVAIGGLHTNNLSDVRQAGAEGFAVIGAIYDKKDYKKAVESAMIAWNKSLVKEL